LPLPYFCAVLGLGTYTLTYAPGWAYLTDDAARARTAM
jgi:hypothetical protein